VAHGDPSRFDPVVLHEIAHVRARDVSWVSAVRWIAWLTVPAVALAQLASFRAGTTSRSETGYVVLHAAALVAATVVIAAGLLRRREIEADRLAVQWLGSPEALRRLLDTSGGPAARGGLRGAFRWCLRPLARAIRRPRRGSVPWEIRSACVTVLSGMPWPRESSRSWH
jgi:hypothetical protein